MTRIFLAIIIGVSLGYCWGLNAIRGNDIYIDRSECSWKDVQSDVVMLDNKIPAKLIVID